MTFGDERGRNVLKKDAEMEFSIVSHGSASDAPADVLRDTLSKLNGPPSMVFASVSIEADLAGLQKIIDPALPLHGSTTCLGVMTDEGAFVQAGRGCGFLAISDPAGAYGSAMVAVDGSDIEAAAERAVLMALDRAQRPGETPELIWLTATPGIEERVIASIHQTLGEGVPICGGSAADNEVAGDWMVFDGSQTHSAGISISVLFPSVTVGYAFHSGYRPTQTKGRVSASSGRQILSIDGRPGAVVYNEWTQGRIEHALTHGGSVIANTSLAPLGRSRDSVAGFDYYLLSHPEAVNEDGALALFSDISVGDEIVLMEGTADNLVQRAGRVAENALSMARLEPANLSGALVIYCAGCMLTVQDRMDEVASGLREVLGEKPFLGSFTFGEQGCFIGGSNHHGNLMISVVVFGA